MSGNIFSYNNLFHKLAMSNNIIKYSLWLSVFIWMLIVLLLVALIYVGKKSIDKWFEGRKK